MIEWTMEDQAAAFTQGWGVFENSDHGLRIERLDEKSRFSSDDEAIEYVAIVATGGSQLAIKAINFIKENRK